MHAHAAVHARLFLLSELGLDGILEEIYTAVIDEQRGQLTCTRSAIAAVGVVSTAAAIKAAAAAAPSRCETPSAAERADWSACSALDAACSDCRSTAVADHKAPTQQECSGVECVCAADRRKTFEPEHTPWEEKQTGAGMAGQRVGGQQMLAQQ